MGGFTKALPFLGGAAALAAPFLAPALFGADAAAGAGAAAGTAADVGGAAAGAAGPATAGITAGTSPLLSITPDISLDVSNVATPLDASGVVSGAGGAAGVGSGVADALQGAAPALGTTLGTAGPATEGGTGIPPGNAPVSAQMLTNTLTPVDPAGAAAGATDLPGLDPNQYWGGSPGTIEMTPPYLPPAPPTGGEGFLSKVGDFFSNNKWIGPAAAVGGLGLEAIQGLKPIPGSAPVSGVAGTANTNAANLTAAATPNLQALSTGTLPAGAQSAIDQASNAAKASIRSQFANMGITGPYSGESEAIASVDQNAAAQKLQQMQNLVSVGATEAGLAENQQGLASQDYVALMNAEIQRNAALQAALSRFSGSLAGPALATTAA